MTSPLPPGQVPPGYPPIAPPIAPLPAQPVATRPVTARPAGGGTRHPAVIAVVVTAVLLLCYAGWAAGSVWVIYATEGSPEAARPGTSATPSGPRPTTTAPRHAVIVYEVTGEGRADINYLDPSGSTPTTLSDTRLPWRIELPRQPVRLASVTIYRSEDTSGPIRCRLLVDGREVVRSSDLANRHSVSCAQLVRPS